MGLCWLTTLIHTGAVGSNPLHTLAVLSVTLGPFYDAWVDRYKDSNEYYAAKELGKKVKET